MRFICSSLFFFLLLNSVRSQVPTRFESYRTVVITGSSQQQNDSLNTRLPYLILNPAKIQEMNVVKGNTMQAYGDGVGAVFIKTKPGLTFIRLNAMLDKYKIMGEDRKLKVCIDQKLVMNPALILADENEIEGLDITTARYLISAEEANRGERFINIRTVSAKPITL